MDIDFLFERLAGMGIPGVAVMLLLLAGLMWLLMRGADWLVEGAAQLAYGLKIPKIIVGATVVSLGTTMPEAAVSVVSAVGGDAGLALGNAIGSVICDTGLVFGIGCLMTALPVDRFIMNRHGWLQFGFVLLLSVLIVAAFVSGGVPTLTRQVGIMFLILLGGYFTISIVWAKQHPLVSEEMEPRTISVWRCCVMLFFWIGYRAHYIEAASGRREADLRDAFHPSIHCFRHGRCVRDFPARVGYRHHLHPATASRVAGRQYPRRRHPEYSIRDRRLCRGQPDDYSP